MAATRRKLVTLRRALLPISETGSRRVVRRRGYSSGLSSARCAFSAGMDVGLAVVSTSASGARSASSASVKSSSVKVVRSQACTWGSSSEYVTVHGPSGSLSKARSESERRWLHVARRMDFDFRFVDFPRGRIQPAPPDNRLHNPIIATCPCCRVSVPPVPCAHVRGECQFASGAVLSPGGHDSAGRGRP